MPEIRARLKSSVVRWGPADVLGYTAAVQEVSKMPEFFGVWRDLLNGRVPGSEEASTSGRTENSLGRGMGSTGSGSPLATILAHRSPPKLLLSRVTPEMEQHMYFFTKEVRLWCIMLHVPMHVLTMQMLLHFLQKKALCSVV